MPRPLREVRGRLDELLARPDDLADLAGAWVKVVLTDPVRPAAPMERLREKWPHTLVLDFDPDGGLPGAGADLARLAAADRPGRDLRPVRGVHQRRRRRTTRSGPCSARPWRRPSTRKRPPDAAATGWR